MPSLSSLRGRNKRRHAWEGTHRDRGRQGLQLSDQSLLQLHEPPPHLQPIYQLRAPRTLRLPPCASHHLMPGCDKATMRQQPHRCRSRNVHLEGLVSCSSVHVCERSVVSRQKSHNKSSGVRPGHTTSSTINTINQDVLQFCSYPYRWAEPALSQPRRSTKRRGCSTCSTADW